MACPATPARSLVAAVAFATALATGTAARADPPDTTSAAPAAAESTAARGALPGSTAAPPVAPSASSDWDTLSTGLPEQVVPWYAPVLAYERVDGPLVGADVGFKRRKDDGPLLHAWLAFAFSRDRGLGGAGFDVPLGYRGVFHVGADVYRKTTSEDGWIVGGTENTLFALFARTDYRDWYEAKGGAARVLWDPGRDVSLRVSARIETHSSLRTRTRVSLFGKDDRFRPNPEIDAGDLGAWTVGARVGPDPIPAGGGGNGSLTVERAGEPIARDFAYTVLLGDAHARYRLSTRQSFRVRAIGVSTRDGTLPAQYVWALGGIGTLRALDYKSRSGDQLFLANAEYYVLLRKNVYPMAFLDWGAAWFGRDNLSRQQPSIDGGVGLRLGEGPILVTLGRDLGRSGAPLRFGVRLGGPF